MWLKEAARGRGCVLPVVFINYTRQQYEGMQRGRGAAVRGEEGERRVAWRQLRFGVASVGCACATNLLHLREIFIMISFSVFLSFFSLCYNNKLQLQRLQYDLQTFPSDQCELTELG